MIKWIRAAWDRLTLYLPVILMVVLALGTYWLVRSSPMLMVPDHEPPLSHDPDYFMHKFSVNTFDSAGRLKSEVFGADARHFPDTDTLEIDLVRIRSFDKRGRLTTASASYAVTHGDGAEVQLIGNARVIRESVHDKEGMPQPRMEFRGEFLHAFMEKERIESHKPVELIRGSDQFTADTMVFDNLDRLMLMNGRVKGTLVPILGNLIP